MLRALRVPSPLEWLALLVMSVLTTRYFWLMDDAFIYFRYVDNLLFLGRGLVFNPGEYVEGFSGPLWIAWLIPLRALGLNYYFIVGASAVFFALIFGGLVIAAHRQLSPVEGPRINLPLLVLAGHYGVLSCFSSGLESPLVLSAAPVCALYALRPESRVLQVVVGALPLVRPELLLPCVVLGLASWLRTRRLPVWLAASAVAWNGAYLAFRVVYYADLLPNTYYLKAAPNLGQGLAYLKNALEPHFSRELALVLAVGIVIARRQMPLQGAARLSMLACAVVVAAWVARIGGDMLYFRYLAFAVPLALLAGSGIAEGLVARFVPLRARGVTAIVLGVALLLGSASRYPPQLRGHPLERPRSRHWHYIADPMWHRKNKELRWSEANIEADRMLLEAYARFQDQPGRPLPAISAAWCRRAYFAFNRHVIHALGLTDAMLSRVDAPFGRPGHRLVDLHARDLLKINQRYPKHRGVGLLRHAVEEGRAPEWVKKNLESLELVEHKIYNSHALGENLALALTRVARIPVPNAAAYLLPPTPPSSKQGKAKHGKP